MLAISQRSIREELTEVVLAIRLEHWQGRHSREPIARNRRYELNLHQTRRRGFVFLGQQINRGNAGPGEGFFTVRGRRSAHVSCHEGQARTAGAGRTMRAPSNPTSPSRGSIAIL